MSHCVFFRLQNNGPGSPKGTEKGSPLLAKQHSDLSSSYHHIDKSSKFQTRGPGHSDITTDSESGLDWFHSLAGPVEGGDTTSPFITSPITTSTQDNHNSSSKQARNLTTPLTTPLVVARQQWCCTQEWEIACVR